jgi:formate dehydrogenase major subunit
MLHAAIDNIMVTVEEGTTILQAAQSVGIDIPTLCHLKGLTPEGSCRMCLVELEGARGSGLVTACSTPLSEGNIVFTNTPKVIASRRFVLDLLLSNHELDCFSCTKNGECKLQEYCYEYGLEKSSYQGERTAAPIDNSNEFFIYNPSQCILCRRCVRICAELHGVGALTVTERGFGSIVSTPFDLPLGKSDCVSCGNCVSYCPVGALAPKSRHRFRAWETSRVSTTCAFCGVGCQMELLVKNNKIVGVNPLDSEANRGLLCVKGKFGYGFVEHSDRLKRPMIRKDGTLVEVSWDEALDYVAQKMLAIKAESGPDALAGLASARCTNEENYLFQKMMRAAVGTNNVDHCARLCHASTVAGLAATLGSGAMTNTIAEAAESDVLFITGSNTTETHPVIGSMMRQAKKRGAKIIVAEPRRIPICREADIFLQIQPGTNVALFNGLMHAVIALKLQDSSYIEARTEGFKELKALVADYTPEKVGAICGIQPEDLLAAARMYATAEKAGIYYSMGVTQHSTGTDGVISISNLALLCGKIGKRGCGVNPLRGQNNVQGACDVGALPGDYPGYQKTADPKSREKFEKAWGVTLPVKNGLTILEMFDAVERGDIRGMYIMGENPMLSDPNLAHVEKILKQCEFLVVQDIFMTETAELADVVLPACSFAEKDGTFTNTERRIQRVRKAVSPPGEARGDHVILLDVMMRLGYKTACKTPGEIMDEIASVTPSYGGVSFQRLERESLQWPCPDFTHPGTPILHTERFSRGERALFKPRPYLTPAEQTDDDYPHILTTGRILYQYHTRTMTGRIEGLNAISGTSYVEINPVDAAKLGVADGESIKLSSRRGTLNVPARVTETVEEGVVFMPFHFADGPANILTNTVLDPVAKIPELKVCAVRIEKSAESDEKHKTHLVEE